MNNVIFVGARGHGKNARIIAELDKLIKELPSELEEANRDKALLHRTLARLELERNPFPVADDKDSDELLISEASSRYEDRLTRLTRKESKRYEELLRMQGNDSAEPAG